MTTFEWDVLSKYYDLIFDERLEDIPFWEAMAKEVGSPILELSCGNGRLTFPIAENGINVTGIDLSKQMLRSGKQKLKKYPKNIQKKVKFLYGNTNTFRIKNKFKAVFCPEAFWPLTNDEEIQMLSSIKNHLSNKGYLVLSVNNFHKEPSDWKSSYLKKCKNYPSLGFTMVRRSFISGDAKTNIEKIIHFLDLVYKNGKIKRIITERQERQRTKDEVVKLLESNGFEVKKIYGEYDKSKWRENSKWTIVIAQLYSNTFRDKVVSLLKRSEIFYGIFNT